MDKLIYEKHHVEPVSLYWENSAENLMIKRADHHRELHKAMDISPKFIREVRERLNWVLIYEPKHIEVINWLKKRFFENLHRTDRKNRQDHKERVIKMYNHKYHEYRNIIDKMKWNDYGLTMPEHKIKTSFDFDIVYDRLCDLQKAIAYANVQKVRYEAINYFIKNQWKQF